MSRLSFTRFIGADPSTILRGSLVALLPINYERGSILKGKDIGKKIEKFIDQASDIPIVVVQGLGYVGAVMSVVCANAKSQNYAVIGIDRDTPASRERIKMFNDGKFPLTADDPKVYEYFNRAREKGNIFATWDATAYMYANIIIVDVNLDVSKQTKPSYELEGYSVDMEGFTEAIRAIGRSCQPDALILVETTVPPGTSQSIVKPTIGEELRKRGLPTNQIKIGTPTSE